MKEIEIIVPVTVKDYSELDACERSLVDAARRATAGSYSVYSHSSAGAAILLDNGVTVTGANQRMWLILGHLCRAFGLLLCRRELSRRALRDDCGGRRGHRRS